MNGRSEQGSGGSGEGRVSTDWPLGLDPSCGGLGMAAVPQDQQEAEWRRQSVDVRIANTAATMAAAAAEEDAHVHAPPSPSTRAARYRQAVKDDYDDRRRGQEETRGGGKGGGGGGGADFPSSASSQQATWSPRIEVECMGLSLWVKPLFGPAAAESCLPTCMSSQCCRRASAQLQESPTTLEEGGGSGGGATKTAVAAVRPLFESRGGLPGSTAVPAGDNDDAGWGQVGVVVSAAAEAGRLPPRDEQRPRRARHEGKIQILHDISFMASPGEVVACMGPSGSGKTSLVTAVAGRLKGGAGKTSALEGRVLFNGADGGGGVAARRIGFVTQDDTMFASLTVRETLRYAALLRLPSAAMSRGEKVAAAAEVTQQLGLESCADTIIGGVFTRGVSGGERKRVSIAVELITNPSVLILDEPTSGLDSTIALRLADTLAALARDKGRTVLLTIHQPSSRVMGAMDAVLLLSKGRRVYYGAVAGVAPYFATRLGYAMPFGMNPADFVLDLANGDTSACGGGGGAGDAYASSSSISVSVSAAEVAAKGLESPDEVVARLTKACAGQRERIDEKGNERAAPPTGAAAAAAVTAAAAAAARTDVIAPTGAPTRPSSRAAPQPRWACPWHEQTALLLARSFATRRGQLLDTLKLSQVVLVALMVGALWWQRAGEPGPKAVADTAGLLFFELLFLSFLTLFGSLFTFPDERAITVKERQSGMYRVSAYFCARSLADIPLDLFIPCIFIPIVYWMGGLRPTAEAFLAHTATVMLLVLVASSMGLLIGACVTQVKRAQTVASVLMLAVMLTGGFYFDKTPHWLNWTKQISYINHAYALLLKIQLPGGVFPCAPVVAGRFGATGVALADVTAVCTVRGAGLLTFVDLEDGVGVNVGALVAMLLGMRALTYVALRFLSLKP